jgi:cytochrome c biogenesis protein CcdA
VFTIIDILLLFLFYEIVLYTMKDFLNVNRYLSMAWGILMILLGILVIVIEIPLAKKDSEQVWKRMSTNEQAFFTNDKEKLRKQRSLNSMYVGVFTIVKGVLFLGVSLGLFLLDRDLKQRMVWKTTSRLPEIESHEQVVFK